MRGRRIKGIAALVLSAAVLLCLCGCGARARKGTVFWLNDDPERNAAAMALANRYERERGVNVRIITPAQGEYGERLAEYMGRRDSPTLFALSGEAELDAWQPSCLDLRSTALDAALRAGAARLLGDKEALLGIGYGAESFGLIVNTALLERAGHRPEDIASYEDLRQVAEDIQARSDALGFSAFTSAGLRSGSSWRFTQQLFNLPVTMEYRDRPAGAGKPIRGTYMKNYRQLLDLYFDNSTRSAQKLGDVTVEDARAEFLAGQAVFYQNSSREYDELRDRGMDTDKLTMIPLYIGAGDEAAQGLCTDVSGYWCVNQNAPAENLQATVDFLLWCAGDKDAARTLELEQAFFDPAGSDNPFVRAGSALAAAGKQAVEWNLDALPQDKRWEKNAALALADYAAERNDESWEAVRAALIDDWAEFSKKSK